ncbi:MAG: ABC transporter permease [Deltaproteobacteria bacterium]|nr:ABC transporter permease [Deltaproteobacteria bacterium]
MRRFLLRRLLASLVVVLGVPTLVFGVIRMAPGDPAETILGEQALPGDKARWRALRHLDEPLHVQYGYFLAAIADGSLGTDYENQQRTVSSKLLHHFPATLQLALAALAVALLISLPLGLLAALRQYSWIDHGSMVLALLGISMPAFWLGPMLLILFSQMLRWLPNPGDEVMSLPALILPAICLGAALAAKLTRMTRSSILEVLREEHVVCARARGLPRWLILTRHVLRNALIPVVTVLGMQLGALLTGAIVTEKVFARPGLGTLLLDAIEKRNFDIVQGTVLLIAFLYLVVNLLTDLAYAWIDPRVRYQ